VPGIRQGVCGSLEPNAGTVAGSKCVITLPNLTKAGNALAAVVWLTGQTAPITISISDDQSNANWAQAVNNNPTGNESYQAWLCTNIAAGTKVITVTPTLAMGGQIHVKIFEMWGVSTSVVSSALDGTSSGTSTTSTVSSGSITPTQSGDLLFQFGLDTGDNVTTSLTKGSGWTLAAAQLVDGICAQYQVYNSVSAITPSFTKSGPATTYVTLAMAIKAQSGAGDSTMVNGSCRYIQHHWMPDSVSSRTLQFPCTGNCIVISVSHGNNTVTLNTPTDGNSNTYTVDVHATASPFTYVAIAHADNATTSTDLANLVVAFSSAPNDALNAMIIVHDMVGMKSPALGATKTASGTQGSPGGNLTTVASFVPNSGGHSCVVLSGGIDSHTCQTLLAGTAWEWHTTDMWIPEEDGANDHLDEADPFGLVYTSDTSSQSFVFSTNAANTNGVQDWAAVAAEFLAAPSTTPAQHPIWPILVRK